MISYVFLLLTREEDNPEDSEEIETEPNEDYPEVAVIEFDEHAELQSRMWNQFMRAPKLVQSQDTSGSLIVSQRKIKTSQMKATVVEEDSTIMDSINSTN